ncbi:class I SAM-dependent methyltransferase [Candidatus Phycosocius spiralis]|uniref:ATP synthase subunit beta n=1 Tax=Candidatus Phycosocius spiralis TaxID=2815099 RepID=A0ABQ4PWW7_9PROT|nr:SAM-dependent methyltransferase [Candidatus Phycosocius spiralis]GIU67508.1 ATP synthase subunit beta [Candidatus Phycosocius spiralis]
MTEPARAPATELEVRIARMIAHTGPIGVDVFMAQALYNQEAGYYRTQKPLGSTGDFTTAPEISQIFGELIGLWLAQSWLDLACPTPFNLIELGPGRGSLIADVVRVCTKVPGFLEAADVQLVETNPYLRASQRRALGSITAHWHETLEEVPSGPSLILANEFFDCLPIRQFILGETGWHEKLVGLDGAGRLTFGLGPALVHPPTCAHPDDTIGVVREMAPGLEGMMDSIARRLLIHSGRALIMDYGDPNTASGDTLQALYRHHNINPLDHVGEADITAHVDFAALLNLAQKFGLTTSGPTSQREFLCSLGIEARRDALIRANPHCESELSLSVERLIGEAHMGQLFQVVSLDSPLNPCPGPPLGS